MDDGFGFHAFLTRRSTAGERAVLVWLIILGSAAVAMTCFYFGFTAPAEKAEQAGQLRLFGYGFAAAAGIVWLVERMVSWWMDR